MKGNIVIGLFMLMIILVVFTALIPTINTEISNALPYLNTADQTLIQLLPLAILFVILTAVLLNKMSEGIY